VSVLEGDTDKDEDVPLIARAVGEAITEEELNEKADELVVKEAADVLPAKIPFPEVRRLGINGLGGDEVPCEAS